MAPKHEPTLDVILDWEVAKFSPFPFNKQEKLAIANAVKLFVLQKLPNRCIDCDKGPCDKWRTVQAIVNGIDASFEAKPIEEGKQ